MSDALENLNGMPVGPLGLIVLPGCEVLADKINNYLISWRKYRAGIHNGNGYFDEHLRESYIIGSSFTRFATGEAKATINQSVRGYDIFILCDMFNHGATYKMHGKDNYMSPDDHYANLKRVISAIGGKAKRITVIMPMLYEGRQHRRQARESLDCANALQELCLYMGVQNIITFDAHDARVQNAIPLHGFENVQPVYQMIKALSNNVKDLRFDKDHMMIISPDEGGMSRGIYYSNVLKLELGMFYKQRDYSRIVDGRNPVIAHEFLGDNVKDKDVIVVDDMISSGGSMLEVGGKLKDLGAKRIFMCVGFGLFCNGLENFDKAYEEGIFTRVFSTNLVYRTPELLEREWFVEVDLSKYVSYIVDTLNHDSSVSKLLNPVDRIEKFLKACDYKSRCGNSNG